MRSNLPVTQREHDYPAHMMLVSTTDTKGHITHCNAAFVEASGFGYDELIGQPHNIVRHPDMPPEAYRDMWRTIGNGLPWTGLVKNRRKNGDHYWVVANATPIMDGGKPVGYMSVRTKPTRQQIQDAEALYARMNTGTSGLALEQGRVMHSGFGGMWDRLKNLKSQTRVTLILLAMLFGALGPWLLGLTATELMATQAAVLVVGSLYLRLWFQSGVLQPMDSALQFSRDIAACNLTTQVTTDAPEPTGALLRSLSQIQVNLQAVIGDVRSEVQSFGQAANEISSASHDLASRTEMQASSLEETAASMEQLSATVKHTADNTDTMAAQTLHSAKVAAEGQQAIHSVGASMKAIEQSSSRVSEIIAVIEGIAFQTNILALNAAVEAARAGEQGRGFAVVAGEVRALAQRSGLAAKEIRDLIQTSVVQVSTGVKQMSQANTTIDEVVNEVRSVSTLVDEIRHATNEQADGLMQINTAIVQLDNVTQQNAAMVEQTNASASALETGSQSLTRSVSVFRLPR